MLATILIVEDNADNLKLMSYLLNAFGHRVLSARDGAEGLDIVRREPLDLIICDVQLPKMDGYEVARELKSLPGLREIPLVAVTALAMVGDRDKVLAAGFNGYLPKPIVPRTFVSQVEAFLRPEQHSAPRQTAPTTANIAPPPLRRGRVLVVDNSPVNIDVTRKTLGPFGYEVLGASGVPEALAVVREVTPDLILSDVHMPQEDGYDFIKAVKADPGLRAVPFIFISSTVWQEADREQGLALGANKFLLRPMEPQALLGEIEDCLRQAKGA